MSQSEPPAGDARDAADVTDPTEPQVVRDRDDVPPGAVQVQLRRAPRFLPFMLTGAVLGLLIVVTIVLLRYTPEEASTTARRSLPTPAAAPEVSTRAVLGYLGSIGALLGGLAGAGLAVFLDRRSGPPAPPSR